MFTGIIMATGRVISIEEKDGDLELGIDARALLSRSEATASVQGTSHYAAIAAEATAVGVASAAAAAHAPGNGPAPDVPVRLRIGDSVSVQGACLTVTRFRGTVFYADVSRETMAKTTLGALGKGSRVNLEPSLRAGDALGGHMVSGHVDAVGRLAAMERDARSWRLEFELPLALMRFVAPKGSICIDGVSLTVNQVGERRFDVNIIPHTSEVTTLGELVVGAGVNVEIDLVARYLDRLAGFGGSAPG